MSSFKLIENEIAEINYLIEFERSMAGQDDELSDEEI